MRLQLGDVVLSTTFEGNVLTAAVPLAATRPVGELPLLAIGRWGEPRSEVVMLTVTEPSHATDLSN